MEINFNFTINAVAIVTGILAWGSIIFLAYRVYKRQSVRPKVWKILLVMFVGLFSFSFKWNMFDTISKVSNLASWCMDLIFYFKRKGRKVANLSIFCLVRFLGELYFLGIHFNSNTSPSCSLPQR